MKNQLIETKLINLLMNSDESDGETNLQKAYEQFVEELYLFIQIPLNRTTYPFTLHHIRIELQALQFTSNSKATKKYGQVINLV